MGWRSGGGHPCRMGQIGAEDRVSDDSLDDAGIVRRADARPRRKRAEPSPTQRALGLLVRREHSQKELSRKLAARGVAPDEAQVAIAKLRDAGWQDDARFAETLIRSRAATGYGPLHIRAELATHGLGREAIAVAMDEFDCDWSANARELVQRRFGVIPASDRQIRRKAADLLIRRGFGSEHVRAAGRPDTDD